MWRPLTVLMIGLWALCVCRPAFADRGERTLGLELGGGYPPNGRASLFLQEGLSDWVGARLEAGVQISELESRAELESPAELESKIAPEVLASFGFVVAFDVFAWVPEIFIGAGGAFGEHGVRGRLIARGGLRKYLAMDWSLTFGVIGEWIPIEEWLVLGAIGIWWHFDDGL